MPERLIANRYRLLEVLGRGGFGEVWKAVDLELAVEVALKRADVSDPDAARAEARLAAPLAFHPHIVAVTNFITDDSADGDGAPWVAMRYIKGQSLAEALKGGPMTPEEVARIASALLSALDAAHKLGITHRDVKPANILLGEDGGIFLTDFGIAKLREETVTLEFTGSIGYAAPERWDHAFGDPNGPAGDLFSVGATLYRAVEGVAPFEQTPASPESTLHAVCFKPHRPMVRAGRLAPLLEALLVKNAAERPGVAEAQALLGERGGDAGGVAAAAGSSFELDWRSDKSTVLSGHTEEIYSVAFSPDGRTLASASKDRTVRLWDVASGTALATLSGHENPVSYVAFSPDGRTVLSYDSTVRLWDVGTGRVTASWTRTVPPNYVALSPDGSTLAANAVDSKEVALRDATTGRAIRTFAGKEVSENIAFSPDGTMLASVDRRGSATVWDVRSGSVLRTVKSRRLEFGHVTFSPDGATLCAGSSPLALRNVGVCAWNVPTGVEVAALKAPDVKGEVWSLAYSGDGRILAVGGDNGVTFWDVAGGGNTGGYSVGTTVYCAAFSPGTGPRLLAAGCEDTVIRLWCDVEL